MEPVKYKYAKGKEHLAKFCTPQKPIMQEEMVLKALLY
jgi:hypothetical protein